MAEKIVVAALRASVVVAEVGIAMQELAPYDGAIFRLGLAIKHLAGAFELTGEAQQLGFIDILCAVNNAREEALANPIRLRN